jgi:hypothetical protein
MRFPNDRDQDHAFIESLKGTLATGSDREVAYYTKIFEQANNAALDPSSSAELLATRAKEL